MALISFGAYPYGWRGELDDSSRLDVVEIARVAWHARNSAHEQTPLSNDTIDSVLRHREVGRAKDLSALLVYKQQLDRSLSVQELWHEAIPVYRMNVSTLEAILWRKREINFPDSDCVFVSVKFLKNSSTM
jgi:hypothetical protein